MLYRYMNVTSFWALITLVILLFIAIVIFAPLALIWALNTLFGLKIAYTLINWFAAFVLLGLVGKPGIRKSQS